MDGDHEDDEDGADDGAGPAAGDGAEADGDHVTAAASDAAAPSTTPGTPTTPKSPKKKKKEVCCLGRRLCVWGIFFLFFGVSCPRVPAPHFRLPSLSTLITVLLLLYAAQNEPAIPIPYIHERPELDKLVEPNFKRNERPVRFAQTAWAEAQDTFYDMDSEDEDWLAKLNKTQVWVCLCVCVCVCVGLLCL